MCLQQSATRIERILSARIFIIRPFDDFFGQRCAAVSTRPKNQQHTYAKRPFFSWLKLNCANTSSRSSWLPSCEAHPATCDWWSLRWQRFRNIRPYVPPPCGGCARPSYARVARQWSTRVVWSRDRVQLKRVCVFLCVCVFSVRRPRQWVTTHSCRRPCGRSVSLRVERALFLTYAKCIPRARAGCARNRAAADWNAATPDRYALKLNFRNGYYYCWYYCCRCYCWRCCSRCCCCMDGRRIQRIRRIQCYR